MKKDTYRRLEGYMLECMKDSAHDKEHVYRVLNLALEIASQMEKVDYDVLIAACLLHDIGRQEQFQNPKLCHALIGGQKAFDFLIQEGWEERTASRVRECIETHRFRADRPPCSQEGKILFDADKVDVSGAMGIARTLLYKGSVGEPLYTRGNDGCILDGHGDALPSFFQEYVGKLEKVYDRFYTEPGRELAFGRRHAAVSFYEAMKQEVLMQEDQGKKHLEKLLDLK